MGDLPAVDARIRLEVEVRRVQRRSCAKVRRESFYTKRFAYFVGRRCRTSTIQDVAREVHLAWRTVKDLDQ